MKCKGLLALGLLGALGCNTAQKAAPAAADPSNAWPAGWDALCPASGAAPPVVLRVADVQVRFEPSGAAVWNNRVLVAGDKQAHVWWWIPGTSAVVEDPAWNFALSGVPGPNACCSSAPGDWGSELKRKKAAETCGDHQVALGTPVPWFKAEGATSNAQGLFVTGNMGFGCEENGSVLQLPGPGAVPTAVPGTQRQGLLDALGAKDLRVEGVAVTPDSKHFYVAVRSRDDVLSHQVVRVGASGRTVIAVEPPAPAPEIQMGLSDITVLRDGRVAVTVSREEDVAGKRVVAGELWVTTAPPRDDATSWPTQRVAVFADHKPEGLVQLSPTCVAVLFDDDETYKAQQRAATPSPQWDSSAAFVGYVRLP